VTPGSETLSYVLFTILATPRNLTTEGNLRQGHWTFRIARTLEDYYPEAAENKLNPRIAEQILEALKTIGTLANKESKVPSTYESARSDLTGISSLAEKKWVTRDVYDRGRLQNIAKIITMIREVLKVIVDNPRTPPEFWYLWIVRILRFLLQLYTLTDFTRVAYTSVHRGYPRYFPSTSSSARCRIGNSLLFSLTFPIV